jgi:hypothetical protein
MRNSTFDAHVTYNFVINFHIVYIFRKKQIEQ